MYTTHACTPTHLCANFVRPIALRDQRERAAEPLIESSVSDMTEVLDVRVLTHLIVNEYTYPQWPILVNVEKVAHLAAVRRHSK